MAKKKDENTVALTDEQLNDARVAMRAQMKEKFDKWITVYDEDATDNDIDVAKKEFDDEVAKYYDQNYILLKESALEYAKLLKDWNAKFNLWENGSWKGVIMFDKVLSEMIEKYEADNTLPFEVDYATLMYMYKSMGNPHGMGLESAKEMAKYENLDPTTCEPIEENNYISFSHILQEVINQVRELAAIDKKLKLMRERINIATAGIKFDWKITEVEEFIQLHDAWVGQNLPDDDKELQRMANL